jgi:signal transduction histidine kinase
MTAESRRRLNTSLWRAFVLQIVLISATAFAGVFLAEFAIRELLIVSALEREADYFWARRKITADTPAPNTNTLIGYVFEHGVDELPEEFANLSLGIHDVVTPIGESVVHVSADHGTRLYLVFDAKNVTELATYFGIAPLGLMLIVLYSSAWVAYRITRRAVSPVILLARSVRDIDLETPDLSPFEGEGGGRSGAEIDVLAHALRHLLGRVDRFIDRERMFTREASHELRSPLTVIRMACDNLLRRSTLDDNARDLADKIRHATRDMEELTEILLLLARENEGTLAKERVVVNEVLAGELAACRMIYDAKPIEWHLVEEAELAVASTPRVLAIVFGNVLRNAGAYTETGTIVVRIAADGISIADSGRGMSEEHLGRVFIPAANRLQAQGNGIGLGLVKRIADRFDWQVDIRSTPNEGTTVTIGLPGAEVGAPPRHRQDDHDAA